MGLLQKFYQAIKEKYNAVIENLHQMYNNDIFLFIGFCLFTIGVIIMISIFIISFSPFILSLFENPFSNTLVFPQNISIFTKYFILSVFFIGCGFVFTTLSNRSISSKSRSNITQKSKSDKKKVFIVHGHDFSAKQKVSDYLEELGLIPIILGDQPDLGKTIIEKVEYYLDQVSFAVILLTGDDVGGEGWVSCDVDQSGGEIADQKILESEKKKVDSFKERLDGDIERHNCYTYFEFACEVLRRQNPRSRQNVIFELGITIGFLGRDKVRVLYEEGVELPSDIHGLVHIPLNSEWKKKLLQELIAAKIVNLDIICGMPLTCIIKKEEIPAVRLRITDFKEEGWEAQTLKKADKTDSDWQYWDTFLNLKKNLKIDSIIHRYPTIDEAKKGFSQNKSDYAKTQIDGRLFDPEIDEESYGYVSSINVEVATFRIANLLITNCYYFTDDKNSIKHAELYARIINKKVKTLLRDKIN